MLINKSNISALYTNEAHIHDHFAHSLEFFCEQRSIKLRMSAGINEEHTYCIDFVDVIGFFGTSCSFWGGPVGRVIDFGHLTGDEQKIIPNLERKWENTPKPHWSTDDYENYIEVILTFSSGDKLAIACKQVEISGIGRIK